MTTSMTAKSGAMAAAALVVAMAHPVAAFGWCASPAVVADVAACIAVAARAQCGAEGCNYFADASNECAVRVWLKIARDGTGEFVTGSLGPSQVITLSLGTGAAPDVTYRWGAQPFCSGGTIVDR